MKLKHSMLWLIAVWLLLALACQTLVGGEEADLSTPVPAATNDTPDGASTPEAVTPLPTAVTDDPAEPEATATEGASSGGWDELVIFNNLSQAHDPDLQDDYGPLPPAGGTHNPVWANCGFYDEPIWTEQAIHSLEHGTVWVTYRPDLPVEQLNYLRKLPQGHTHVLVSPYLEQESDVVMTAWGLQLVIPSLPDERVEEFIDRYENGPQNPEPGAPCSGGTGEPE